MINLGHPLQGNATAVLAPEEENQTTQVKVIVCDVEVPPASEKIIGDCQYYYKPQNDEFVKKSGVSTREMIWFWLTKDIQKWAFKLNPWEDMENWVLVKLFRNRDALLPVKSSDSNWSRHANFMMRHIGCGHTPPPYYISYGYYYCSRYGKYLAPRLSAQGQEWLENGRRLLQINMEDGLQQNMDGDDIFIPCKRYPDQDVEFDSLQHTLELSHDKCKEFAFKTHVPAYLDAGLADLSGRDLRLIGTQPNIEEWGDGDTWSQAYNSTKEVFKEWRENEIVIKKIKEALIDEKEAFTHKVKSDFKEFKADVEEAATDALEKTLKRLEILKFW